MISERRLRELLLDTPVPDQEEAERRGLALVGEAYAGRPRTRRSPAPRLALAMVAALALAALVLSPAGASVRHWVGGVFDAKAPPPGPALTEVPGGGRLLVQSEAGAWVVQPDGSRRLLGAYDETTWSPRGLFVGAAAGRTLSAIEPGGTVHWSLSAPGTVSDPRWSPSGFRIAYRSGGSLRLVHADGTHDSLLDPRVAPVPPAWSPLGPHQLAYVDRGGRLRLVEADTGRTLGAAGALPGATTIDWAAQGSPLLEASPRALRTREVTIAKLSGTVGVGPPRSVALPAGATVEAAAFSPQSTTIAAILGLPPRGERPPRSELVLVDPRDGIPHTLLSVPGNLTGFLWSPDGSRLLVSWSELDEWLFIPARGHREGERFGPISAEFAAGSRSGAELPRLEGWCCPKTAVGDPDAP